jgi:MFS family permease
MLVSLALLTLGSALAGASQSISWLVAARCISQSIFDRCSRADTPLIIAITGIGAGGTGGTCMILLSDIVPLSKRGTYLAAIQT